MEDKLIESHYVGSAIVQDNGTDLLVVIPVKKNVLGIIYTSLWLCVWLVGELSFLTFAAANFDNESGNFLALIWVLLWSIGGIFVVRSLVWNLSGKEFIAIDHDVLILEKKGLLFSKPKEYDTTKVRNIRIQQERGGYVGQFVVGKNLLNVGTDGIIRFDYGKKTVKFADSVGKADATTIIQEMKAHSYLTEIHFNSN